MKVRIFASSIVASFALSSGAIAAPGVMFTEALSGHVGGHGPQLTMHLQVATDDVQAWENDPNHIVQVKGTAAFGGWSFPVAGQMGLLEPARAATAQAPADAPGRYLRYSVQSVGSKVSYTIECAKHVQDGLKQNIITAMTVCPGSVRVGAGAPQPVTLDFDWKNPVVLAKFLASFHAIHTSGPAESAKAEGIFFKTIVASLWDTLSKNSQAAEFLAPDSGPNRTPYACTFHWFPLNKGPNNSSDWLGLDLVRSDDTGKLALRAFLAPGDGGPLRAWIQESKADQWAPFATNEVPDLSGGKSVLGRGKNWIAGRIDGVAFNLSVEPLVTGINWGHSLLDISHISAADDLAVRFKGWVEIAGQNQNVDAVGTTSIHYGDFLPQYAYVLALSQDSNGMPPLLVSAIKGDSFKLGGELLKHRSFIFGHGAGSENLPGALFNLAALESNLVPLQPEADLLLSNVRPYPHQLLGQATVTGIAQARVTSATGVTDLGRVVIDFRGQDFVEKLSPTE